MKCCCQLNVFESLFRIEVEEEIRKQVDELMRQELKNLKMVRTRNFHFFKCLQHRHCKGKPKTKVGGNWQTSVTFLVVFVLKAVDREKGGKKGKKGKKSGKKSGKKVSLKQEEL